MDADEYFTFYALMGLVAWGTLLPSARLTSPGWMVAIFALAFFTTFPHFFQPIRQSLTNLFVALLGVKAIADHFDMNTRALGRWLFFFCVASLAWCGVQAAGLDRWYFPGYEEIAGFSWRPWILGCQVALATPFMLQATPVSAVVIIPLLWLSHSTTCMLAGAVGAVLFYARSRDQLLSLGSLALVLVAAYFIFFDHHDDAPLGIDPHRIQVWRNSWKFFRHPWLGAGLGSWAHEGFIHLNGSQPDETFHWRWAHNEYYQQLFEQGRLGLVMATGWLASLFLRTTPVLRGALASLAILAFFHPVLHYGKITLLICVILGCAVSQCHRRAAANG